jgi:hypothetical protein
MVPASMTMVQWRIRPVLAAAPAGVPLPIMNRLPTGPADAAVQIMSQGVEQSAAAAGDSARDDGPIMLLVPEVPAALASAADPMMMQ